MKAKLIAVVFALLFVAANIPIAQCSVLYGISGDIGSPALYKVDQNSGNLTTVGTLGATSVSNLASDWRAGSPRLWTVDDLNDRLLRVDPFSGVGTVIGTLTAPGIRAIAFDVVTDTMFAIGGSPQQLYTVNVNTAATTLVGPTNLLDVYGLGVDLAGSLYAGEFSSSNPNINDVLVKLNKLTGAATTIGSTGVYAMVDFAARPEDGVMFGTATIGSFSLYRVNTATGAASLVGPFPSSGVINGLAFLPDVPEPSTVLLIAMAFVTSGTLRRRPMSHNRV